MGRYNRAIVGVTMMLLVGLGVSACSGDDDSAADSADSADSAERAMEVEPALPGPSSEGLDATMSEEAAGDAVDAAAGTAGGSIGAIPGRAIATTAGVTVLTTDMRTAVDDTLTAVERNEALVFAADVSIGDERDDGSVDGSVYFVVEVPPGELELLITDLGATVGEVAGRTQDSADVTDQLVDLDIRIGVERDIIDRFRGLLGDATALTDIIEIERVISERTVALEQLLASQSNLEDRVAFSTLTIELRYTPPAVDTAANNDTDEGIAGAWRTGLDGFVGMLFAIGFVLAVSAPFLVTALVMVVIAWLALRRWRAHRDARSPSTAGVLQSSEPKAGSDPVVTSDEQQPAEPSRPG